LSICVGNSAPTFLTQDGTGRRTKLYRAKTSNSHQTETDGRPRRPAGGGRLRHGHAVIMNDDWTADCEIKHGGRRSAAPQV